MSWAVETRCLLISATSWPAGLQKDKRWVKPRLPRTSKHGLPDWSVMTKCSVRDHLFDRAYRTGLIVTSPPNPQAMRKSCEPRFPPHTHDNPPDLNGAGLAGLLPRVAAFGNLFLVAA